MTDLVHRLSDEVTANSNPTDVRTGLTAEALRQAVSDHLTYSIARPPAVLTPEHYYRALALAVRDRMQQRWMATTQDWLESPAKVTCYLSAEFLMGPQLGNNLLNLGIEAQARQALTDLGQDLDIILSCEKEPGLGNGGLGRLAACYLDSLATLERPSIGYGIRYEFGIFEQEIHDGWQVEKTDNWLVYGNPWEIDKPDASYMVNWGGYTEEYQDDAGRVGVRWVPHRVLKGVSYDTPIQGFGVNTCNTLTLWSARAVESFALEVFNTGDFYKAVDEEVISETVSKVLYPNDEPEAGKRLRLLAAVLLRVLLSAGHPAHPPGTGRPAAELTARQMGDPAQRHPPVHRRRRADAAAGRRALPELGRGLGDHGSHLSATPTTPCCPRRWRPGRCRCSVRRCPATSRSSCRSTRVSSPKCGPASPATTNGCGGCR